MCKADGCTVTKIKGHGYCNTHYARFRRNGNMEFQERKHPIEERFWRFVTKLSDAECWKWQGSKSDKGYGKFPHEKEQQAHRVSYILFKGEIPEKTMVLHHCDNPSCVNPSHLYLGDNKQNMVDMISRNRAKPRGKPPKLTDEQVRIIAESTDTRKELSERFCVCISTIGFIKSGKIYSHLDLVINPSKKPERLRKDNDSKLSDVDIDEIRLSVLSNKTLSRKYKVSPQLIAGIRLVRKV